MGMVSPPVQGQKLLPFDEWQYDNGTTLFNETVLETIQVQSGESAIATSVVQTDRPVENDYKYSKVLNGGAVMNASLSLDLQETLNVIWLTQAGGFPINSYAVFSGSGSLTVQTPEHGIVIEEKNFTDVSMTDSFHGNPSLALTTAESQTFGFTRLLGDPSDNNYLVFGRQYIISTDQSATDPIRNYTITPTFLSLEVKIGDNKFVLNKFTTETIYEVSSFDVKEEVSRPANLPQAQLYQYDSSNRLPLLIRQTEPSKIGGLSLNALEDELPTEIVEYKLVQDTVDTSDSETSDSISTIFVTSTDDGGSFIKYTFTFFILSMIILVIVRAYKQPFKP